MTTTEALHRLTSYEPGRAWDAPVNDPRILQGLKTNDAERKTPFVKQYATTLPRIPLPREFLSTSDSVLAVLAGTAHPAATALDLTALSRLLHLSAGVVRTRTLEDGFVHPFRASGSAGARFPLELYVAIPEGGILPGVHWYDPVEHALVQVGPAPRTTRAAAALIALASPGAPAGATASAGTATSTGMPGRCCRRPLRSPTRPGWTRACTPSSPMRPSQGS
jgi:hypothetical protein